MKSTEHELPVIVNGESRQYAELAMAGYQPIAQGYRKQLEEIERDILEGYVQELELNNEMN
jgi:hypothetical protein